MAWVVLPSPISSARRARPLEARYGVPSRWYGNSGDLTTSKLARPAPDRGQEFAPAPSRAPRAAAGALDPGAEMARDPKSAGAPGAASRSRAMRLGTGGQARPSSSRKGCRSARLLGGSALRRAYGAGLSVAPKKHLHARRPSRRRGGESALARAWSCSAEQHALDVLAGSQAVDPMVDAAAGIGPGL